MKNLTGLLLITVAFCLLMGCQEKPPKKEVIRPVRAVQVEDPSAFTSRWFPGKAKATQEVDLSFRVAGPLVTFPVKVGDVVTKGQILAKIDPRDFKVSLQSVKAQLSRIKAELKRAEADYKRVMSIRKQDPGAVSQALIDRTRQVMESARAQKRSTIAAVQSAEDQLSYTKLRAPFGGTIVATFVENYEDVKAKQPIVRLIDHSRIEMIVSIPETIIHHAEELKAAGRALIVLFDPFPGLEVKAGIKEIGKEASKTTRTYPVTLIMDQPKDVKILPGMAGKAKSTILPKSMEAQAGIVVPETAVFSPEGDDKVYVWVIDEKSQTVSRQEVKTGDVVNAGITILEGIKPGMWVATAGAHYLKDGQKVRLLTAKGEAKSK